MATSNSFCGHCGEAASDHCKGCMNMTYCSVECQQADWQFHKLMCKEWAEFKEKPGPDMRRAILLPERGLKPIFKWLCVPEGSDSFAPEELGKPNTGMGFSRDMGVPTFDCVEGMVFPDNQKTFGPDASTRHYVDLVCGKLGSGELLDHSIHLWVPNFDYSMLPNNCLAKLAGEDVAKRYHGDLTFVAMTKVEQQAWTLDLDTRDLTLALDGLVEYNKKAVLQYMYHSIPKQPKNFESLKVNVADPFINESIKVAILYPEFGAKYALPLMHKLQIPIYMFKYRTPSTPPTPQTESMEARIKLNVLRTNVDSQSAEFGVAPIRFHDDDGASVLLAHKSKHLTVSDLAFLVTFLEKFVVPELRRQPALPETTRDILWMELKKKYEEVRAKVGVGLL